MLQTDRPTVVRPPPRSGADPAPAPTPRPPRVPSVPTRTRARRPAHAARVHFRRAHRPLLPRHRRVFAADRNANPFLGPLRGLREARCPGPLDAQRTRTRGSTREADGAHSGQHARGVAAGEGPTPSASLGSATAAAPGPWRGPASGRRVRGDAGPCPPRAGLDRPPALPLRPAPSPAPSPRVTHEPSRSGRRVWAPGTRTHLSRAPHDRRHRTLGVGRPRAPRALSRPGAGPPGGVAKPHTRVRTAGATTPAASGPGTSILTERPPDSDGQNQEHPTWPPPDNGSPALPAGSPSRRPVFSKPSLDSVAAALSASWEM